MEHAILDYQKVKILRFSLTLYVIKLFSMVLEVEESKFLQNLG